MGSRTELQRDDKPIPLDAATGAAQMNLPYRTGLDLPWSKLNPEIVRRIRKEHAEKEIAKRDLDARFSAAAFAKRYGVSTPTIEKVLSYETWRHVL